MFESATQIPDPGGSSSIKFDGHVVQVELELEAHVEQ